MTTAELSSLREIVGRESVQGEGLAREYAIEGRAPEAVVEPESLEELAAVVALAAGQQWPLVAWGGGTQMCLGSPPARYRLAVTTRRMNRVLDYQPDDMTVSLQGGVILDNLARMLGERGQFLPLDPPLPQRATAGGTVAAASSGPLRAGYGTPRDYLIGAAAVGADGKVVRPGGRVVKNVAGYDLCKLYTGSLGTLGILGELNFKVLPRPRCWGYSAAATADPEAAEALVAAIMDSDLNPAALELVNGPAWELAGGASPAPARCVLLVVFAGVEEAVAWQQATLEETAARCGLRAHAIPPLQAEPIYRAVRDYPARPGLAVRLAGRSSDVARLAADAEKSASASGRAAGIVAHAASGVVWVRFPEPPPASVAELAAGLRELAARRGATAVVVRLPEGSLGSVDRWGPEPPGFAIMNGIKNALDPAGLLSPGRFVGGL